MTGCKISWKAQAFSQESGFHQLKGRTVGMLAGAASDGEVEGWKKPLLHFPCLHLINITFNSTLQLINAVLTFLLSFCLLILHTRLQAYLGVIPFFPYLIIIPFPQFQKPFPLLINMFWDQYKMLEFTLLGCCLCRSLFKLWVACVALSPAKRHHQQYLCRPLSGPKLLHVLPAI